MAHKDLEVRKKYHQEYREKHRAKANAYNKQYRAEHLEKLMAYNKEFYYKYKKEHPERLKLSSDKSYRKHREQTLKKCKEYYYRTHEKQVERRGKYYLENKEKILAVGRLNRPKHRAKIAERHRNRYQTDIQYKLACRLRTRLWNALDGDFKRGSAVRDLGCSIADFKLHLQSQFTKGMSWDNYGKGGWSIDHIIPLDSFDLTNRIHLLKVLHYSNLQPLWEKDNASKGKKIKPPVTGA